MKIEYFVLILIAIVSFLHFRKSYNDKYRSAVFYIGFLFDCIVFVVVKNIIDYKIIVFVVYAIIRLGSYLLVSLFARKKYFSTLHDEISKMNFEELTVSEIVKALHDNKIYARAEDVYNVMNNMKREKHNMF